MQWVLVLIACVMLCTSCSTLEKKIKNVIVLIPDGASLAAVSSARWYQRYNNPEKPNLHIDPYLCGTILTYSSNAPIGDSAPTTSCYMTGVPSRAGWVSTYPTADPDNDIVPLDSAMAYQPLMTVLEAARITQNKSTGLVFTCEFPHATPADCAAHSYNRAKYEWIAPQMVHNGLDVVIGGGVSLLTDSLQQYLKEEGYGVYLNDMKFAQDQGTKMWALFKDRDMSYDIDRKREEEPSLAEMTAKAIELLSKNENGFFLMVEGSKIDWAAHANDAATIITDFLAFDEACGVAFDFARLNEETVVVVMPDHGNSGISIGARKCPGYSNLSKDQLFGPVSKFKISVDGLIATLHNTPAHQLREVVLELTGIELDDEEYIELLQCQDYDQSNLSNEQRMYGTKLSKSVAKLLDNHTCFGFTTGGHTGEEVFLAVYDPTPNRLMGHNTNIQLNHYLRQSLGLPQSLEALNETYFVPHHKVFEEANCSIEKKEEGLPTLWVEMGADKLEIRPNTNIIKRNGKEEKLSTVVIYVDKNDTFYLPRGLMTNR
jgi:Alkaline phosphatase